MMKTLMMRDQKEEGEETTIISSGKRIKVKLDPVDKAICNTLNPYFDMLYTKSEPGMMKGIYERINNTDTFLNGYQIPLPNKKNPLDIEGTMLQREILC
jgi:hypothetical protein